MPSMGNIPNFASRLEGLTRNLDAAIVIDETTHDRIEDERAGFERYDGIPIKGRDEAFTVYALPLGALGALGGA